MKTAIFSLLFLFFACGSAFSQPILGAYDQSVLDAPAEYQSGETVTIAKDPSSDKKIWISGLIPKQKFYALLQTKTEDGLTYSVPKQRAGNYQIEVGCIIFLSEDQKITISLNNKEDCADSPVSVGREGLSAGGARVGSAGRVSAAGVDISGRDIRVNTKAPKGITYIGEKKK